MADIRINALATTAASTASDDFVAVDGSANGTRKLNAFSPTFGGNLTVSGSGTNKFGGGSNDLIAIEPDAAGSGAYVSAKNAAASDYEPLTLIGETVTLKYRTGVNSSASGLTLTSTATTLAGNLTVSGTGNSTFSGPLRVLDATNPNSASGGFLWGQAGVGPTLSGLHVAFNTGATSSQAERGRFHSSGNFLLKSDGVDSGNGKLQLATHTTSAGGIGFGTDLSLYRANTGFLILNDASAALDCRIGLYNQGTQRGLFEAYNVNTAIWMGAASAGWSTIITSGNQATALTLDSSQNATFAGNVVNVTPASGSADLVLKRTANTSGATVSFNTTSTNKYFMGLRGLSNDNFYLYNNVGGNTALEFDAATSNATFAGSIKTVAPTGGTAKPWELGEAATVSPTSPNRTIRVEIDGTVYYLHAKTTND